MRDLRHTLSAMALLSLATLTGCGGEEPTKVEPPPKKVIMGAPTIQAPAPEAPLGRAPAEAPEAQPVGGQPLHIPLGEADRPAPEPPQPAPADDAPGEVLAGGSAHIKVASGESFGRLAKWAGISARAIAEHNDLPLNDPLQIGQSLHMPLKGKALADFTDKRRAFAKGRVNKFFKRKGGLEEVVEYTVKRGDRATKIARKHGLPLWILISYNAKTDLNSLSIGDVIQVPITGNYASR
ncbi:MAG: LysM peptidoglycan-binding domain-containing protein [Bradymonadia bacterium]